jgi:hypothetical protein
MVFAKQDSKREEGREIEREREGEREREREGERERLRERERVRFESTSHYPLVLELQKNTCKRTKLF